MFDVRTNRQWRAGTLFAALTTFVATLALADAPQAPSDSAPLTPEAIYLRAVHAMKAAAQPRFVTFRENVAGRNFRLSCTSDGIALNLHHGDIAGAYDVSFRTRDGGAVSRTADGTSTCPGTLLAPAGADISSMGVPAAMPSAASDATSSQTGTGLPIIAAERVEAARFYHVELAGREHLGGNDVYHLKLTAYRDPDEHPLTDLFVDPQTFLIREARGEASGHYLIASGRVAGIVDFDRVGDYWLVEREHFDIAANALLVHVRMNATIDASNVMTPADLPGVVFPTPEPTAAPKRAAAPPSGAPTAVP
jgi:hypothetical protein